MDTVRDSVDAGLADQDGEVRCVAVLAASELAENVVKYGDSCDSARPGIEVEVDEAHLRVRSVNCVKDPANARAVMTIVDRIAASPDAAELYVSQMQESLRDSGPATRLGLYRVAAEGGLRLSHEYANGCLTITAERSLR